VAGEAAALAIGLLLLGTGPSSDTAKTAITELLGYAHDTAHEKIIRGLSLGIALIMYGQEENAEALIEQLSRDRDPILRYGAMFTIGLAYAGTSNNSAIRRLLHVAVSDVSDDVRRAAVINLGYVGRRKSSSWPPLPRLMGPPCGRFVLFRSSEQVPRLVSLLAESFNPHVRCVLGAA
jgi:26S proteasome regulatory subunit N2